MPGGTYHKRAKLLPPPPAPKISGSTEMDVASIGVRNIFVVGYLRFGIHVFLCKEMGNF